MFEKMFGLLPLKIYHGFRRSIGIQPGSVNKC